MIEKSIKINVDYLEKMTNIRDERRNIVTETMGIKKISQYYKQI